MEKAKLPPEETIQAWLIAELTRMLDIDAAEVDIHDSFASYGLVSVDAVSLATALEDWLGIHLSDTVIYDHPNIAALSLYLASQGSTTPTQSINDALSTPVPGEISNEPIAIIGLGCRFPGASDTPERFWQLLRDGQSTTTEVPAERWNIDAFYDADPQASGKMYTRFGSFVFDIDCFDAKFFGLSPREAMRMDPQQRLLLEVTWEALERAGIPRETLDNSQTGVFVGMMTSQEYMYLQAQYGDGSHVDDPYYGLGGAASIAAGRLSYLLNLKGPALTVDTACSSSLVATHLACQSLRNGESNLALVAGVNAILLPENIVNFCKMGMLSEDGCCKTFDAAANGFVLGEGCGVVVLKRLSEALADGNTILAVIRGSAVNQDGRSNGLTAPNRYAQEAVIRQALANAGVSPLQIQYVEAHGSGTALGDPIEVDALMAVMGEGRDPEQPLQLGAVKTNIGHLAGAAGIAGLIKTVLALHHQEIPPHLHVQNPNPHIDWQRYPVEIVGQRKAWVAGDAPRRAGVSSFGWSGTNAHLVLEEAPVMSTASSAHSEHLLLLSAKTESALELATERLATYLQEYPQVPLADVAYTTQTGRTRFGQRRAIVAKSSQQAGQALTERDMLAGPRTMERRPVAFLFPGLGEQIHGVCAELYRDEPVFRATIDQCCAFAFETFGLDLRSWQAELLQQESPAPAEGKALDLRALMGRQGRNAAVETVDPLRQTELAQPVLFIIEYALARMLHSWGIVPAAMLGYSLGEYVAACLAGVFSLEDALILVVQRARLIQSAPQGAMLAVASSPAAVESYLNAEVNLAAINAPLTCVLAGPIDALEQVKERLEAQGIISRRVETMHAFHSTMLTPLRDALTTLAQRITLHEPHTPYISNVTGNWITAEQATDPAYWAKHMCQTVQFANGVEYLLNEKEYCILEVGPGQALSSFVKQHPACESGYQTLIWPLLPAAHERRTVQNALLTNLGKLWLAGVAVDWQAFHAHEQRHLVPLPTYAFEKQRYWVELTRSQAPTPKASLRTLPQSKKAERADWFYLPVWEQVEWPSPVSASHNGQVQSCWLIFLDQMGLGEEMAQRLTHDGQVVVRIAAGERFQQHAERSFSLRSACRDDYDQLCRHLQDTGLLPTTLVHCGSFSGQEKMALDSATFREQQEQGFYSLLFLIQALQACGHTAPLHIKIISNHLQRISSLDNVHPEHAPLLAIGKIIQQEYPQITCDHIDLDISNAENWIDLQAIEHLLLECRYQGHEHVIAHRDNKRWLQRYQPAHLEAAPQASHLRVQGVYLITGGLGDIGLALAEYLARTVQARLVLLGRSALPARDTWEQQLSNPELEKSTQSKLRRILALEALGAEVLPLQADVAEPEQMQAALQQTLARFGTLHGVFHAAGNLDQHTFKPIQDSGRAECEAHFASKVYGTIALRQALQGIPLDFCLLFSSISAILGGLGFVGYAAGNSFLDSFAQYMQCAGQPWISVNWDTWLTDGIREAFAGKTMLTYAMEFEEGIDALNRVLANKGTPHIINSTGDLQERIQQWSGQAPASADKNSRKSLGTRQAAVASAPISGDHERAIAQIWKEALGVKEIGLNDNFFEMGGNSLIGIQVIRQINKALNLQLPNVVLFEAPTISTLARYTQPADTTPELAQREKDTLEQRRSEARQATAQQGIALIGMSGRFPGATSIEQFWENLHNGVESISFFSKEELAEVGVPDHMLENPAYVRARPILENVESFDAAFFGYTPRDADLLDPQHRLFLECCWEAMEMAGYDTQSYKGLVGVFGGSAMSTYLLSHANSILGATDIYQLVISNDKDSLTTTVSYKLNLKGPSVAVQTFCSTSLVAVHLACRSLLDGECDMAMAGGVSVRVPSKNGYLYQEGGMESIDGHCRTFDAGATGSLFGDGVGVVVLKRLEDALADGDTIHAVIKGTAINNDGSLKVSYSAPSVIGQTEAIKAALASAGVPAESISYVEAHGTATELGDPIEVTALTKAFRAETARRQFCAIGSVKTNVGHLDRAAGVSGLLKAALALEHEELPASLHYQSPNPEIDFANSPFYVNARQAPWKRNGTPRRAMVNSLGMGGTNAHVILEEAPSRPPSDPSRASQLFVLSARTTSALESATENLRTYLQRHPEANLADIAYTLQVGRRRFEHRRMFVSGTRADALSTLAASKRPASVTEQRTERPLALLFPETELQWTRIARALYPCEVEFRAIFDRGSDMLLRQTGIDLRHILSDEVQVESDLDQQSLSTSAALFLTEYALGHVLLTWGLRPQATLGSGVGAFVAACLAGILTLEDALFLVMERARILQASTHGSEQCINAEKVANLTLQQPQIPLISSVTGTWITAEEALDPAYWARLASQETTHLKGIEQFLREPDYILLTTGSENIDGLCSAVTQSASTNHVCRPMALPALPIGQHEQQEGVASLLSTLGQLWLAGIAIDWERFYSQEKRYRLPLPTYPFERQRYWIETDVRGGNTSTIVDANAGQKKALKDWFYLPGWKQTPPVRVPASQGTGQSEPWLFFLDDSQFGERLIERLHLQAQDVTVVSPGEAFQAQGNGRYTIHPARLADYEAVLKTLQTQGNTPIRIVHLWSLTTQASIATDLSLEETLNKGFYSLLLLAQALGNLEIPHCDLNVLSNNIHDITGHEHICPEKATILGPCRVITQEYATIRCRNIDIALPETGSQQEKALLRSLSNEIMAKSQESVIALRGQARWVQSFEAMELTAEEHASTPLRQRGVYMITGGTGGIGLIMASYLAQAVNARLVLVGRTELPPRQEWPHILASQGDSAGLGWKIRIVQNLEQQGTELLIVQADVTNEEQMRDAFQQALSTFGTLHGILHTAGMPGVGLMQIKSPATAAQVLAPKVAGTRLLTRLVQGYPELSLDFLALFSSITSVTGGPGQVDYCAANAFLDAYAHCTYPQFGTVVAVDWSEWQWNAWEAGLAGYDAESQQFFRMQRQTFGITAEEGTEALMRILNSSIPHVVVSPQPFQALLDLSTTLTASTVLQRTREQQQGRTKHPRPDLASTYVPPRNDLERQIAAIWEDLLGIASVGVNDNFFDLGGNSLIGLDLVARLKKALQIDTLAAYVIYEAPSISALALVIEQGQAAPASTTNSDRGARRRDALRRRMSGVGHAG
ncbi:MAG TPA: SDR family NAD(P)-dependent oxidoreductase [Ktedonobacteraceae bacterium]|nr:SDR family NAD(P)-dependent oxidoreductase [Ktedonobacteraceae bacterium]